MKRRPDYPKGLNPWRDEDFGKGVNESNPVESVNPREYGRKLTKEERAKAVAIIETLKPDHETNEGEYVTFIHSNQEEYVKTTPSSGPYTMTFDNNDVIIVAIDGGVVARLNELNHGRNVENGKRILKALALLANVEQFVSGPTIYDALVYANETGFLNYDPAIDEAPVQEGPLGLSDFEPLPDTTINGVEESEGQTLTYQQMLDKYFDGEDPRKRPDPYSPTPMFEPDLGYGYQRSNKALIRDTQTYKEFDEAPESDE